MKNNISKSFLLTLMIVVILLALGWLPVMTVDGYKLRKVDLLGDIKSDEDEISDDADSVSLLPPVKPAFMDTCKTSLTCIEDYSDSTARGMKLFF